MKSTLLRAQILAPDGDGLIEALSAACLVFLWAADPFAASAHRPDVTAQIKAQVQRFTAATFMLPSSGFMCRAMRPLSVAIVLAFFRNLHRR